MIASTLYSFSSIQFTTVKPRLKSTNIHFVLGFAPLVVLSISTRFNYLIFDGSKI